MRVAAVAAGASATPPKSRGSVLCSVTCTAARPELLRHTVTRGRLSSDPCRNSDCNGAHEWTRTLQCEVRYDLLPFRVGVCRFAREIQRPSTASVRS